MLVADLASDPVVEQVHPWTFSNANPFLNLLIEYLYLLQIFGLCNGAGLSSDFLRYKSILKPPYKVPMLVIDLASDPIVKQVYP